jgi:uncharacterized protein (DUF488 family)
MDLIKNILESEPLETTSQRIYITSFQGREVTDLPDLLNTLDAILVDVRFAPERTPLKWSKEYLKLLLKNKYLHIPNLGNRSSKEGRIAIQNLRLGIKVITELQVNILLMCRCAIEEDCHRKKIIEKLKEQGSDVTEIHDWQR